MLRMLIILCMLLVLSLSGNAQKMQNPGKDKISTTKVGIIKVDSVDETSAFISYELDSKDYAMFISEITKPEKKIEVKENKILSNETIIYPTLKKIDKVGRFINSGLEKEMGKFSIEGLPSKQDYYLHLYKRISNNSDTMLLVATFSFNTLAPKPKQNAYQLAFEDITDTSFAVTWVNGDGDGRIVVVAVGEKLTLPENGKAYQASSTYGKDIARLGSGFVVYDGKDSRPRIVVTNLEPATKYVVGVIEYNGEGKYRNYSTSFSMTNPRSRTTRLSAPKIRAVDNITQDGCLIRWNKVSGASTYILDLATDKDFSNKVEPYIDMDIGDLGEFELSDIKPKTRYYVRLKAKGEVGESLYSPPFEFKTK